MLQQFNILPVYFFLKKKRLKNSFPIRSRRVSESPFMRRISLTSLCYALLRINREWGGVECVGSNKQNEKKSSSVSWIVNAYYHEITRVCLCWIHQWRERKTQNGRKKRKFFVCQTIPLLLSRLDLSYYYIPAAADIQSRERRAQYKWQSFVRSS